MKAKIIASPFAVIADTALDQLKCDLEYASWFATLMRAIQTDAKHNNGRDTAKLAELGQYLADDMLAVAGGITSHLKSEIDAAEVSQ